MRYLFILAAVLLTGCANTKYLENRVSMSVAMDEVQILSRWWDFYFGTVVVSRDAEAIIANHRAAEAAKALKAAEAAKAKEKP